MAANLTDSTATAQELLIIVGTKPDSLSAALELVIIVSFTPN